MLEKTKYIFGAEDSLPDQMTGFNAIR